MEQIPTKPTGLWDRGLLSGRYGLEQPEAPECRDESLDHLGRRSRADLLSGPLADFSERGGAVELARDEVVDLSEPEEPTRYRVLDDDNAALAADDEIAPELGLP